MEHYEGSIAVVEIIRYEKPTQNRCLENTKESIILRDPLVEWLKSALLRAAIQAWEPPYFDSHQCLFLYLAGVHRNGCEGSLGQGHCGPQQISCVCPFLLIFSAVFYFQFLFRQNSFIASCIARWREELEFSMSPPKQKANPIKETSMSQSYLWYTWEFSNWKTLGKFINTKLTLSWPHFSSLLSIFSGLNEKYPS